MRKPVQGKPRAAGRNRVLWAATVLTPEGVCRVRVRDLSSTGAQVLAERALPAGCDAIFQHGEVFVAAKVAWSNETEAGIQFYRDLTLPVNAGARGV